MIQKTRLNYILIIATTILLIPFIAMQFTKEVNWSIFDFIVAGCLLYGTGLAIELVLRKIKSKKTSLIVAISLLLLLLIVWAELAVGIFGTPFAGN